MRYKKTIPQVLHRACGIFVLKRARKWQKEGFCAEMSTKMEEMVVLCYNGHIN